MRAQELKTIVILGCVTMALTMMGLGTAAAPSPGPTAQDAAVSTNEMCPVMTDEAVDPNVFIEYEGQKAYFCCRRCLRQFQRNPQEYLVNLAAFSTQDGHDHENEDQAHATSDQHMEGDADAGHSHGNGAAHEHAESDDHKHSDAEADHDEQLGAAKHDHEHDHGDGLPPILQWLGKFHPATVHFPIGLLLASVIAEFLFVLTRRLWFDDAGRFCLWAGTVGAVVAASLGWLFGGFHLIDDDWLLTTHRWVGTATAIIAVGAVVFSERLQWRHPQKGRGLLRLMLALVALLTSVAGFLGGAMIYGIDHYAW